MLKIATLATAAVIATATAAFAHESIRPIDQTRTAQERQIEQGRYQGDLTRREALGNFRWLARAGHYRLQMPDSSNTNTNPNTTPKHCPPCRRVHNH